MNQMLQNEIWPSLPVPTLLSLCKTNKEYYNICSQNSTWVYLIDRDFGISYTGDNAQSVYKKYQEILNYFSPVFPIITLQALEFIANFVSDYQYLRDQLKREYVDLYRSAGSGPKTHILDLNMLYRRHDIMSQTGEESKFNYDYTNILIPDFSALLSKINSLNDDAAADYIISLAKGNDIIFVNKTLKEIDIRLDDLLLIAYRLYNRVDFNILLKVLDYANKVKAELEAKYVNSSA